MAAGARLAAINVGRRGKVTGVVVVGEEGEDGQVYAGERIEEVGEGGG